MYILGTDEAGYGPNLGPLVISVSVWDVPVNLSGEEMYKRLYPIVCPVKAKKELKTNKGSFLLDDSKKLYHGHSSSSVKHLEYALLTALRSIDKIDSNVDFQTLYTALTQEASGLFHNNEASNSVMEWEIPQSFPIPLDADKEYLNITTEAFQRIQNDSDVHLTDLRSDVVFPARFNRECAALGNKSTLLSKTTLNLLKAALQSCHGETVVWCDKHGGRNFYADLLNECFNNSKGNKSNDNVLEFCQSDCRAQQLSLFDNDNSDKEVDETIKKEDDFRQDFVEILEQSERISSYRFTWQGYERTIHFQAKSDNSVPAALASIACKYLRELFMNQFNQYWRSKVENLAPTAGYPQDAKRFLEQIRSKIDFPLSQIWRMK